MFELLALALLQLTMLLGSPKASQTATPPTTKSSFATTTAPPAATPTPSTNIGNGGWDND